MSEAQDRDYQPKPKIQEHPPLDESTGFDYRVHIRDAKTSKLIRIQTYARHARGAEVLLERPEGSGNCFFENGRPAGLWDIKKWSKISDTHREVPQAPANREEALMQKNEALEQELAALREEAEARQKAATQKGPQVQKS